MDRRSFIKTLGVGVTGSFLAPVTFASTGLHLVILHTNDTHSRIDPFPQDAGRLAGLGGVARRARMIMEVRQQHPHVLLLDSGDIFQGTPYFNFFGGEIEFKAMSGMGYDVATLGNHDFDNGVDGLVSMMPYARFQFVSSNYEVSRSKLKSYLKPYVIKRFGRIKVGIFGLGIDFEGLVLPRLHEGVRYVDPRETARQMVEVLRNEGCSFIICLSHLGYRYKDDRVSDSVLAREVSGIDLILGGHTHTFLEKPDIYTTESGETIVTQVGFGGVILGRIDVRFNPRGEREEVLSQTYSINDTLDLA